MYSVSRTVCASKGTTEYSEHTEGMPSNHDTASGGERRPAPLPSPVAQRAFSVYSVVPLSLGGSDATPAPIPRPPRNTLRDGPRVTS